MFGLTATEVRAVCEGFLVKKVAEMETRVRSKIESELKTEINLRLLEIEKAAMERVSETGKRLDKYIESLSVDVTKELEVVRVLGKDAQEQTAFAAELSTLADKAVDKANTTLTIVDGIHHKASSLLMTCEGIMKNVADVMKVAETSAKSPTAMHIAASLNEYARESQGMVRQLSSLVKEAVEMAKHNHVPPEKKKTKCKEKL